MECSKQMNNSVDKVDNRDVQGNLFELARNVGNDLIETCKSFIFLNDDYCVVDGIDEINIKCPYHISNGSSDNNKNRKVKLHNCSWEGKFGELSNHLKNTCKMQCSICANHDILRCDYFLHILKLISASNENYDRFGLIPIYFGKCPLNCDMDVKDDDKCQLSTIGDLFDHLFNSCDKCKLLNKYNDCYSCNICKIDNLTFKQLKYHENLLKHQINSIKYAGEYLVFCFFQYPFSELCFVCCIK